MKPYGLEEDVTFVPAERIIHPHKWEREDRKIERRREKKRARRQGKEIIDELLEIAKEQ